MLQTGSRLEKSWTIKVWVYGLVIFDLEVTKVSDYCMLEFMDSGYRKCAMMFSGITTSY